MPTYQNPYQQAPNYAPMVAPPMAQARMKPQGQNLSPVTNFMPTTPAYPLPTTTPYPGQPPPSVPTLPPEGTTGVYTPEKGQAGYEEPAPVTPPAGGNPVDTVQNWVTKRYINPDGTINLPWGGVMPIKKAMALFYPSGPPSANEIPKWIAVNAYEAGGAPMRYWNQAPVEMRSWIQGLYDQAYTNSLSKPPITNMQSQAGYY